MSSTPRAYFRFEALVNSATHHEQDAKGASPSNATAPLASWRRIAWLARPPVAPTVGLVLLTICTSVLATVPPRIAKTLFDQVIPRGQRQELINVLSILAAVFLARGVLRILQGVAATITSTRLIHTLRVRLLELLGGMEGGTQGRGDADVLARLEQDVARVRDTVTISLNTVFANICLLSVVGASVFLESPRLAVLLVAPVPIVLLLSILGWRPLHRKFRVLAGARAQLRRTLHEVVLALSRAGNRAIVHRLIERHASASIRWQSRAMGARVTGSLVAVLTLLVFDTTILIAWYLGAIDVWEERLSLGGLVMYISYLALIFGPLRALSGLSEPIANGHAAALRLAHLVPARDAEGPEPRGGLVFDDPPRVEIINGSFRHGPAGRHILRHAELSLPSSETIVIMGPSGAGKSTLLELLSGRRELDSGEIEIGGHEARHLTRSSAPSCIGFVEQPPFIFSGSIAENIAGDGSLLPRTRILEAAHLALAHPFVSDLPLAYDTIIGRADTMLSYGERQRIALARIFHQSPKYVLLDEITSGLDAATARKLVASLSGFLVGRTAVLSTHDVVVCALADQVIQLEGQRLVPVPAGDDDPPVQPTPAAWLTPSDLQVTEVEGRALPRVQVSGREVELRDLFPLSAAGEFLEVRAIDDEDRWLLAGATALPPDIRTLLEQLFRQPRGYMLVLDVLLARRSSDGLELSLGLTGGAASIHLTNPFEQIHHRMDGRVEIIDEDARLYVIPRLQALPKRARRLLSRFF